MLWNNYDDPILFKDYIKKHSDLYSNNKAANDEALQNIINGYFGYRRLCVYDEEQFQYYFDRDINLWYNQYIELLRIEKTKIDPCVSRYLERLRQAEDTGNSTKTGTTQSEDSNTKTATNTNTGTGESTVANNQTTKSENKGSGTRTDDLTTTSNGKAISDSTIDRTGSDTTSNHSIDVSSNMPQSNVSAATQGIPDSLPWTYASAASEHKDSLEKTNSGNEVNNTTNTNENTQTNTGTVTSEDSRTDNSTIEGSVKTTQKDESSSNNTETANGSNTTNVSETNDTKNSTTEKEIYSGREQSAQELLEKAYDYIKATNAAKWFIDKIEPCFWALL